jgi:hypothetical protein
MPAMTVAMRCKSGKSLRKRRRRSMTWSVRWHRRISGGRMFRRCRVPGRRCSASSVWPRSRSAAPTVSCAKTSASYGKISERCDVAIRSLPARLRRARSAAGLRSAAASSASLRSAAAASAGLCTSAAASGSGLCTNAAADGPNQGPSVSPPGTPPPPPPAT